MVAHAGSRGLDRRWALASVVFVGAALAACRGQAPPVERRAIGDACRRDADCGDAPTFYCATDHPGGACEAACHSDVDCPADTICVGGTPIASGDCHKRCYTGRADCRATEGYDCIGASHEASHAYCDPPGRSEVARHLRGKGWRW